MEDERKTNGQIKGEGVRDRQTGRQGGIDRLTEREREREREMGNSNVKSFALYIVQQFIR